MNPVSSSECKKVVRDILGGIYFFTNITRNNYTADLNSKYHYLLFHENKTKQKQTNKKKWKRQQQWNRKETWAENCFSLQNDENVLTTFLHWTVDLLSPSVFWWLIAHFVKTFLSFASKKILIIFDVFTIATQQDFIFMIKRKTNRILVQGV